jgi:hypothetical protein
MKEGKTPMIDAKDWLKVTVAARKRNEAAIWEKHPYQDNQELLLIRGAVHSLFPPRDR